MSFDLRIDVRAQEFIRQGTRIPRLDEQEFYAGRMLTLEGRSIVFAEVPTREILRALPKVEVLLYRRSRSDTARLRSAYERMLVKSGVQTNLERQFFHHVNQECCVLQQSVRHTLHRPPVEVISGALAGYDIHHRIPLALGGTNNWDNLVFIPQGVHGGIHTAIQAATRSMIASQPIRIAIPYPRGIFKLGCSPRSRRQPMSLDAMT